MASNLNTYRDAEWLENILADIWKEHFSDVDQTNEVIIRYGRRAKRRLGSIGLDPKDRQTSIITINPLFRDLDVPEFIIKATIVHEMSHYAHGFNSPHDQKHRHPHSGGVIRREFAERNLEGLYLKQKRWLKEHWSEILDKYYPNEGHGIRSRHTKVALPWWMRNV